MMIAYVRKVAFDKLMEYSQIECTTDNQDITMEIDELPLTITAAYDDKTIAITSYIRDEFRTNTRVFLEDCVERGETVNIDEADEERQRIFMFCLLANGVKKYLAKNNMTEKCIELFDKESGVLFEIDDDGELVGRLVEGAERPDLLCATLFGGTCMTRPYMDELLEGLAIGGMSLEELEESADEGDDSSMAKLAEAYLNGDDELGVSQDPEKAVYWYKKGAEAGSSVAMYNLGLHYSKGYGVDRDFAKAAEWMQRAADAGDDDAKRFYDDLLSRAVESSKLAENGDSEAQVYMANLMMSLGTSLIQAGPGKDYKESIMWANKAIEQGNADGYWPLALSYHHGRGVEVDIDKAIEYYRKGAEGGNAACQHNLGCAYMNGLGVVKDPQVGISWLEKSSAQGYGLALKDLGSIYLYGNGVEEDLEKAYEYLKKAHEVMDDPEVEQIWETLEMIDFDRLDAYDNTDEEE